MSSWYSAIVFVVATIVILFCNNHAFATERIEEKTPNFFRELSDNQISDANFIAQEPRPTSILLAAGPSSGSNMGGAVSVQQQLASLEQQVKALQAQVAALTSVLKVTANGVTLQAAQLTFSGSDGIAIQSARDLTLTAGHTLNLQSNANTLIKADDAVTLQANGTVDLKGPIIKLNGGSKALATVGSQVQTPGQPAGRVTTGSPNVFGN